MELWVVGSCPFKVLPFHLWATENVFASNNVLCIPCPPATLLLALVGFSYYTSSLSLEWHPHIPKGSIYLYIHALIFCGGLLFIGFFVLLHTSILIARVA